MRRDEFWCCFLKVQGQSGLKHLRFQEMSNYCKSYFEFDWEIANNLVFYQTLKCNILQFDKNCPFPIFALGKMNSKFWIHFVIDSTCATITQTLLKRIFFWKSSQTNDNLRTKKFSLPKYGVIQGGSKEGRGSISLWVNVKVPQSNKHKKV